MPKVADFITIVGDSPRTIGVTEQDIPFNTGGREGSNSVSDHAFIILSVKGLRNSVAIKVNGQTIDQLHPAPDTANFQKTWFTQMVAMRGSVLRNGNNVLELEARPGDNFQVKNTFCFFHQNA